MFNKVKTDHAHVKAPRYAQNVDVVRMGWFACLLCYAASTGCSVPCDWVVKNEFQEPPEPRICSVTKLKHTPGLVFDEPAGLSDAAKVHACHCQGLLALLKCRASCVTACVHILQVLMKNMEVVRTKNQFVLKEGDERGGYKAVIVTLRYTDPRNATFGQMSENNKEKWTRYIEDTKDRHKNYARKVRSCFGSETFLLEPVRFCMRMQPALSDDTANPPPNAGQQAMKWLCSKALAKKEVAMACEVQLMYKPYYFYRKNVHFLYKVWSDWLAKSRPGLCAWSLELCEWGIKAARMPAHFLR